jgi:hypothetical protein
MDPEATNGRGFSLSFRDAHTEAEQPYMRKLPSLP